MAAHAPVDRRSTLIQRDVVLLLAGQAISTAGDRISNIAFLWLVITLTGSAGALTVITTALVVPNILFRIVGGAFIDRVNKKALLVGADVGRAALVLGLALIASEGRVHLWYLVVVAVGLGIGQALFDPTLKAAIPLIVNQDQLLRFNSTMEAVNRGVGIGVPAIAGVMVAIVGIPTALTLDGISFLLSALSIVLIAVPAPATQARGIRRAWLDLREGLHVALSDRLVRTLFLVTGVTNFADALAVVYPVHIADHFGNGAAWYGFVNAAVMVGLFSTNLLYIWLGDRAQPSRALVASIAVQGVGLMAFGLSRSGFWGLPAFFLFGAGMAGFGTAAVTLVQQRVDSAFRGRVLSLYGIFALSLMPVGYAAAGSLAGVVGAGLVIALGGGLMIVTAVVLVPRRKALT